MSANLLCWRFVEYGQCWECEAGVPHCLGGPARFHNGRFEGKKGEWPVPLHKPSNNGSGRSPRQCDPSSAAPLNAYADLTAFLCAPSWPDGSKRELGSLLIYCEDGKWVLKLRDRNGNRYAFYAAPTLQDGLAGVDLGLTADELDWRAEKPFRKG